MEAAGEALREVGFAGASAREIARRAGSTQSQVFYHYGSVIDLLLAALDEVSARRLAQYRPLLDAARTPGDLLALARTVIETDLAAGDLRVLTEMITGASVVPGLGEQVQDRLVPWFEFAEAAVTKSVAGTAFAAFVPARDLSHAVVAAILGLELLASLGEREREHAVRLLAAATTMTAFLGVGGKGKRS